MIYPDEFNHEDNIPTSEKDNITPTPEDTVILNAENASPDDETVPEPVYAPDLSPDDEPPVQDSTPTPTPSVPRQVYTQDEEPAPRMWTEPTYERKTDAQEVYSPAISTPGAGKKEKAHKEKKGRGFFKAVCLVLVCTLLSGLVSGITVNYLIDRRLDELEPSAPQVVLGSNTSGGSNPGTTDNSGSTGSVIVPTGAMTPSELYNMACQQVVGLNTSVTTTNIFGQTTSGAVSGSGFVISSDGYILTNYHVVSYAVRYGGDLTVMFYDGTSRSATVVGYVEENDVAVVKIDATGLDLHPVTLGDFDALSVGDSVYAVGNPLGELLYTMTEGIVSALDRVITTEYSSSGSSSSMNMFQISAAVNSGNSGGPVYNSKGEVIGIVTAKYSESGIEGLGFAIPINDAVALATQLIEKGYVAGASLGIECASVSSIFSSFTMEYYKYPDGACVVSVVEGSAAEAAGLQRGDIIVGVDDTKVTSLEDLQMVLRRCSPGQTAVLTVYRLGSALGEGSYIELTITFQERNISSTETTQSAQNNQYNQYGQYGQYGQYPQSGQYGSWDWNDVFGGNNQNQQTQQ